MANIVVRRDPFVGMRQVMDRLFDESFFRPIHTHSWDEGTLPVDIYERDGKLQVRASLPGFDKDDIDIEVHEGVLSINAKHTTEDETDEGRWYRRERRFNSVSRRIALPDTAYDAEVDAELTDGVLTLSWPLQEPAQPRQIEIRTS
ncbi:MAG: Hsp20/alpha crystallin family protein [Chloroflexi bacterium]|nr:Hsp20/alpha crystallin family protein [Chloroflexota bacterium]